jgi:putative ubiquitin-RnfH superfamily antitoxin RatB of RatAB toxin-antitoxin module
VVDIILLAMIATANNAEDVTRNRIGVYKQNTAIHSQVSERYK